MIKLLKRYVSRRISVAAALKPKRTLVGIELLRLLSREGDRIFTTDRARELAPRVGLRESYLLECLYHLRQNGWIVPLRRGLYALSSSSIPGMSDAHEFEIAMSLVNPAAISHWSALHHHGLTEQIPRTVFVTTTTEASVPRKRNLNAGVSAQGYSVGDTLYRFIQVRPKRFFGVESIWVGDSGIRITNLERTLLDGLNMPRYCGDFGEALHAFDTGFERVNMERITDYAFRLGTAATKRLGWTLELHGVEHPVIDSLSSVPSMSHNKLDPSGPDGGTYNRRWMLLENLPGTVGE